MQSERDQARKVVFDLLTMLASPAKQLAYQADVPIANVPAELVCTWFDDNDFGPDSILSAYFEEPEWLVIRTFNDFYAARIESLPKTSDIRDLFGSDIWRDVITHAQAACKALGV